MSLAAIIGILINLFLPDEKEDVKEDKKTSTKKKEDKNEKAKTK